MNTTQSRLGMWALVLLTCLAVGGQSAFAIDNTKPRVEAAGWVCQPGGGPPDGCQETKFGITGKTAKSNLDDGRFEYMNRNTKYNVHGVVDKLVVNNHPVADSSHPCFMAAFFDGGVQVGGPPLDQPYAKLTMHCTEGSCTFDIILIDNNSAKKQDWICFPHMHGSDKKGTMENYDDLAQPLVHGNIEIH